MNRLEKISQIVVTTDQMRDIENRLFSAGMPVAALMEKVALLIFQHLKTIIPAHQTIGILVGSGHNGGDALVVARELYFQGHKIWIYTPFTKHKELTNQHLKYAKNLGIPCYTKIEEIPTCDYLIDGLFGFGLEREITEPITSIIDYFNSSNIPIISIDIPSGIHTDTGKILGTAIKAKYTLCLGLWKQGILQEQALEYIGKAELIDFNIPLNDIHAVMGETPKIKRITSTLALSKLPLHRSPITHKYKQGHLLLICGSQHYPGTTILTALAARASGVGMLSIAVPASLKNLVISHIPDALVIPCPETETGAISHLQLPENTDLNNFTAIACGPGLTKDCTSIISQIINSQTPLLLDADALNILAELGTNNTLRQREYPTILTPHTGEFKRLFPHIDPKDRIKAVEIAAEESNAIILLKGARTTIGNSQGTIWINPESTPALARGGSGDVLTGLLGGILAQTVNKTPIEEIVATASWWHSQAGILAAENRTELGVDAVTLTQYLIPSLTRDSR
ncbi:NAD(P)H-hydrate dehydratase [Anabaena sp. FACHB-1237]|uniref:NAD(P)H-hydrate dehydratase n=1 Tax=Anabaena sp. FACHB-1237 TaxID=2692769 RepID=UPI0016816094|nr:NAD(P)H-hydrate dehydratase [Anabaena sp. FACHB-1237]MBD2137755.1 NAD(P)H-hydrate dehydratase [Anabaena sp. FACHB-1237]